MNRQIAALAADHALPGEQRLGLEHELGDQPHPGRGLPGVGGFCSSVVAAPGALSCRCPSGWPASPITRMPCASNRPVASRDRNCQRSAARQIDAAADHSTSSTPASAVTRAADSRRAAHGRRSSAPRSAAREPGRLAHARRGRGHAAVVLARHECDIDAGARRQEGRQAPLLLPAVAGVISIEKSATRS